MWPFRSSAPADPDLLARHVATLLDDGSSCAALTSAANDWAAAAPAHGAPPEQVEAQLDAWAVVHNLRSPSAAVRVGRRLHPAARLRVR